MARKTVFPEDHWSLQVDIPYSMGVAGGDLIFLCGQADLAGAGEVRNPGDLLAQSRNAIGHIGKLFAEFGAGFDELVKLVVFYVPVDSLSHDVYVEALSAMLPEGRRPVITLVPVARMFYPGLMVEIDAYGMHGEQLQREDIPAGNGFSAVVRCGEMIFGGAISPLDEAGELRDAGDVVAQSRQVLASLESALASVGACVNDLVKINNWYVAGGSAEEWVESARVRAAFYPEPGPCATGIPLPRLHRPGEMIRTDFWAMLDRQGNSIDKRHYWPPGHWDWPIHLPFKHGLRCRDLVFIGGQVSMDADANVLDPGDMARQTRTSMDNIGKVLAGFELGFADIIKLNTYYQGSTGSDTQDDAEDLHANVTIRGSYFDKPGPASTGIPFPCLAYDDMLIEIEVIAMADGP